MNTIVDDIGTVVQQMNTGRYWAKEFDQFFRGNPVNYLYGHEQEITNRLLRQQQNPEKKAVMYPLICLFLDIDRPTFSGDVVNFKLSMVIVAKTNPVDNAEERYQDSKPFKTVLYPLYNAFFKSLSDSGLFMWPEVAGLPKHTAIDRPFWGTEKKNDRGTQATTANIFNDYLDAIQIKNLEINQKIKNC